MDGSRATARALETITIAYNIDEPRPSWQRRLLAVALTVGGLLGAIALLPLLVLGPRIVEWVAPAAVASATLTALGALYWPVLATLAVAGLATLYHLGVPWRTPWRRDVPGALFAMVLWLLAAAGLRAYLALTIGTDAVFSQLGVPIAVVLWLYVSSVAVLLGAELNAEIERMWPTGPTDLWAAPGRGRVRNRGERTARSRAPAPSGPDRRRARSRHRPATSR